MFCSEKCLYEGNKKFHKTLCPVSANFKSSNLDGNVLLNLRIIVELGLDRLKEKVTKYKSENNRDLSKSGFDENGHYCSDDYRTVYYLETNFKKRSIPYLFETGVRAVFLTKLLLQTTFFGSGVDVHCPSTKADIILAGSTMTSHLLSFPSNAHEIGHLMNETDIMSPGSKPIGAGVFVVCSLLNHSCNPTVARTSYGERMVMYAVRPIHKDEEITDSYEHLFAQDSLVERKAELLDQYCFECECDACINFWPLFYHLKEETFVFCPSCKKNVDIFKHQCQDSKVKLNFEDIKLKIIKLQMAHQTNVKVKKFSPETEPMVLEVLSLLGKCVVHPCKMFNYCQEILKLCRANNAYDNYFINI